MMVAVLKVVLLTIAVLSLILFILETKIQYSEYGEKDAHCDE